MPLDSTLDNYDITGHVIKQKFAAFYIQNKSWRSSITTDRTDMLTKLRFPFIQTPPPTVAPENSCINPIPSSPVIQFLRFSVIIFRSV